MDHPVATGMDPEADPMRWAQATPKASKHLLSSGIDENLPVQIVALPEFTKMSSEPLQILDLIWDLPGTPADTRPGTGQSIESLY